jgi:hypothetical protein
VTFDELGLAARNHAMPPEALRSDLTPVGLHYLLTHYDIPVIDVRPRSLRSTSRSPAISRRRRTGCANATTSRESR